MSWMKGTNKKLVLIMITAVVATVSFFVIKGVQSDSDANSTNEFDDDNEVNVRGSNLYK
jgi:hypothetical protein